MIAPRPKGLGLKKAIRKYQRLESRGARGHKLRRLSALIEKREHDFMRRLHLHQAETKLRALFALIDLAKLEGATP